jgi:hypothetical protein
LLIELAAALLQPAGFCPGSPSGVTRPLGRITVLGGLIAFSELLAPVSVPLQGTSARLEQLRRSREGGEHPL